MNRVYLAVLTGAGRGRRHELREGETAIGREVVNRIVLPDGLVSRRHAVVRVQLGQAEIHDVGSTNGTWLNGARVVAPRLLRAGDTIRVGQTTLHVEVEEVQDVGPALAAPAIVDPDPATAAYEVPAPPLAPLAPFVPPQPLAPPPVPPQPLAPPLPPLAPPPPLPVPEPPPSVAPGYEQPLFEPPPPVHTPAPVAEEWAPPVPMEEEPLPVPAPSPREALDTGYVKRMTAAAIALTAVILLVVIVLLTAT